MLKRTRHTNSFHMWWCCLPSLWPPSVWRSNWPLHSSPWNVCWVSMQVLELSRVCGYAFFHVLPWFCRKCGKKWTYQLFLESNNWHSLHAHVGNSTCRLTEQNIANCAHQNTWQQCLGALLEQSGTTHEAPVVHVWLGATCFLMMRSGLPVDPCNSSSTEICHA